MSNKCFKIDHTCPDKVQAPCVEYQGKLGENSKLEEGCTNLEEVIEELYEMHDCSKDTITSSGSICNIRAEECEVDVEGLKDKYGNDVVSIGDLLKYFLDKMKEDDNRLTKVEGNVTNNSGAITGLTNDMQQIYTFTQQNSNEIEDLRQDTNTINNNISYLTTLNQNTIQEVQELREELDLTNSEVSNLTTEISSLGNTMTSIESEIVNLESDISIINSVIVTHNQKIEAIEIEVQASSQELSDIDSDIQDIIVELNDLTFRVEKLEQDVIDLKNQTNE